MALTTWSMEEDLKHAMLRAMHQSHDIVYNRGGSPKSDTTAIVAYDATQKKVRAPIKLTPR